MDISHETIHETETVNDLEPVESAGLISGLFNKLSGWVDKLFGKLGDIGDREGKEIKFAVIHGSIVDDEEAFNQADQAGDDVDKLPDAYTLLVKVQFNQGENEKYDDIDVYAKLKGTDDSKGIVDKDIRIRYSDPQDQAQCDKEFMQAIEGTLKKMEGEFFPKASSKGFLDFKPIKASMEITLKKIVANDEIDVRLVSINSAYSIGETNEILDSILDSDEFIESMPELEPVSYSVDIAEDGYDVEPCGPCCVDLSGCILKILQPLYRLYFDSMYLAWNTTGPNYQSIVSLSDMYQYMSKDLIDKLSIEHFMDYGYAPHPLMFRGEMPIEDIDDTPIEILQKDIQDIIDAIDLYYCNFDGSLQDDLIVARDKFDTELNYTLARF